LAAAKTEITSSASVGPEVDEFELAKLEKQAGKIVAVPFVAESPCAMEVQAEVTLFN